jgi:outer membrane murein-binding lipoprotein Lpp
VDASNELLEGLPEQTRELIVTARKSDNFKVIISILLALLLYFASNRATGQLTSDVQHLTSDVQQLSTEVHAANEYERCLVGQLGPTIREMNSQSLSGKDQVSQQFIRKTDPCWCGSERKFQRCHGRKQ